VAFVSNPKNPFLEGSNKMAETKQVNAGTKLESIGTVKTVVGEVKAVDAAGNERILQAGDKVFANETIVTANGGMVMIEFADGSHLDLASASQIVLDTDVFNPANAATPKSGELTAEQIQEMIARGEDPTTVTEATAAGAAAGDEGGSSFIVVDFNNTQGNVTSGFNTQGIPGPESTTFTELPPVEDEAAPVVDAVPTTQVTTVAVDEDDLGRGEGEGQEALLGWWWTWQGNNDVAPGDDVDPNSSTIVSGTLNASYGADGAGDIVFNGAENQPVVTSGGQTVQYWISEDGHTLVGYVSVEDGEGSYDRPVFAAEINAETGAYTFYLLGQVDHADPTTEDNFLLNLGYTISDADGDTAGGVLAVNIDDDSPVVGYYGSGFEEVQSSDVYVPTAYVDEDDIKGGNGDFAGGDDYGWNPYWTYLPISFGADGPAAENAVVLNGADIVDQNGNPLTSGGEAVQYVWDAASQTLTGYVGSIETPVFTLTVEFVYGFGAAVSFNLIGALDHPLNDAESPEDNLVFNISYTATDFDGDSVTGTLAVNVDDDSPVTGNASDSVDEGGVTTGTISFMAGADGATLTHVNGVALVFGEDGWSQEFAGAHGVLKVQADGTYSFTAQADDLVQSGGSDNFTFTVTDGDNDTAGANFEVTVNDVNQTVTVQVFAVVGDELVPANSVAEGTAATYVAHLVDPQGNIIVGATGTVDITFADVTATGGVDYVSTTLTGVALGQQFTSDALDDYLADNGETFTVNAGNYSAAASYENVAYGDAVTTTIVDDSNPDTPDTPDEPTQETVTIQVFAVVNGELVAANSVPEGTTATYVAHAVDPQGNIIVGATGTVDITFTDVTATGGVDYVSTTLTGVALGQQFTSDALDDYLADNGETFTVNAGNYSAAASYENVAYGDAVTTTITDNSAPDNPEGPDGPEDTVYLRLSGNDSVVEATGASLDHTITLVDKDGNPVNLANGQTITVTLTYTNDSTAVADFQSKTTTVTITGNGGSSYSFANLVADDSVAEGTEGYTVSLGSITTSNTGFENVAIDTLHNSATGTITDNDVPNININGVRVSEEGLSGDPLVDLPGQNLLNLEDLLTLNAGNPDSSPNDGRDTTNSTVATGSFQVNSLGANPDITLLAPTTAITSVGRDVTWVTSADGNTIVGVVESTTLLDFDVVLQAGPLLNTLLLTLGLNVNATVYDANGVALEVGLQGLLDAGINVGVINGTLVAGVEDTVLKVEATPDGSVAGKFNYTVELYAPVDHPDTTAEDVLDVSFGVKATNGVATGTGTLVVGIEDDAPRVTLVVDAAAAAVLTTQDSDTVGTSFDTFSANFAATFSVALSTSFGADGANLLGSGDIVEVGYSLTVNNAATGLTSHGLAITLSKVGDEIIGSTVNGAVFKLNVAADGTVTLTQFETIDHLGAGNDAIVALGSGKVSLTATATLFDGDGDKAVNSVSLDLGTNIRFEDSVPTSLTPTEVNIIDQATAPDVTEPLNFVAGADGVGTVRFTFNDGAIATDTSTGNQLSFNGQPLYLHYGQTNGVVDYTILVATTSAASAPTGVATGAAGVAYWIDIDPAANTYTMHSNGIISNGTAVTATNLSSVGGGNTATKALSNVGGTNEDVLLTTASGKTVNTNSTQIGLGNGQSFTVGEGIRFDFVNGSVSGNGGNQLYTPDGSHNSVKSFQEQINLTAGASHADIKVTAIAADSDLIFWGDAAGETKVAITGVHVYSGTIQQVNAGTATDVTSQVTLTFNPDGSVNIVGLQDGWIYQVQTTNNFSAVQVDALATTGNYKLGAFSYGASNAGDPVDLSYNVSGTDGDGDAISGTLNATLYPAMATYNGTSSGETIDHHADTTAHYYLGNGGNDILIGGSADDVFVGGAGNDTMTGNAGSDRFILTNGDGVDTIKDFTVAASGGDVLDIGDILAGAQITTAQFQAAPGSYLIFDTTTQPGSTIVKLDVDGAGAGTTTQTVVTLEGTVTNLNTLLTNQQIDSSH
jgi:T1SS-143 domain-containing protein